MRIDDPSAWIPHRPPILAIDAVEVDEPGVKGRGLKRFERGDAWLTGHFPGNPVVPGVALIEGAAQSAAIVLLAAKGKGGGGFLADVSKFRFKVPVLPPVDVVFEITVAGAFGALCKVGVRVLAGGVLAAEGELVLSAGAS